MMSRMSRSWISSCLGCPSFLGRAWPVLRIVIPMPDGGTSAHLAACTYHSVLVKPLVWILPTNNTCSLCSRPSMIRANRTSSSGSPFSLFARPWKPSRLRSSLSPLDGRRSPGSSPPSASLPVEDAALEDLQGYHVRDGDLRGFVVGCVYGFRPYDSTSTSMFASNPSGTDLVAVLGFAAADGLLTVDGASAAADRSPPIVTAMAALSPPRSRQSTQTTTCVPSRCCTSNEQMGLTQTATPHLEQLRVASPSHHWHCELSTSPTNAHPGHTAASWSGCPQDSQRGRWHCGQSLSTCLVHHLHLLVKQSRRDRSSILVSSSCCLPTSTL